MVASGPILQTPGTAESPGLSQGSQSHGSTEKQPLVGPCKEGSLNTLCTPAAESVNSGFHITGPKRGTAVIIVFQMGKQGLSAGRPVSKLRSSGCGRPSQADLTCLGLGAARRDLNCSLPVSPYLQMITNECNDFYQKKFGCYAMGGGFLDHKNKIFSLKQGRVR